MLPESFGEVAEKLRRSTVQVLSGNQDSRGSGSGIIWDADGTIITNAHVVSDERVRDEQVRVELWDGRSLSAEVTARDGYADLAKLRLRAPNLAAAAWRGSSSLRTGELAVAIGNPLGFVGALTTGVVHGAGPMRGLGRRRWVHAAIRLAPGNSGGPLADAGGRVIGVNTMVVSGGLALAIPSELVVRFLERGSRPTIGIVVRPVANTGLMLLQVNPNSAAERASLRTGDLLLGANGRRFESTDDLSEAIEDAAGSVMKVRFRRGNRSIEREVSVVVPGPRQEAA
ncbi:MAG: peptidase and chymotrypsin/Hap [Bryobacterales bacterium]|jgi:serine protease Do|nr:peptidase and chymotrypsin/Hap [Bryobacterales bacterium]